MKKLSDEEKRRRNVDKEWHKAHKLLHKRWHKTLDALVADWLQSTKRLPSEATIMELIEWSNGQTTKPDSWE